MKPKWFGLAAFAAMGTFGVVSPALGRCSGYCNFLYNDGAFTTLDAPGAISTGISSTGVSQINNSGEIVGDYFNGSNYQGFVYLKGAYVTFDAPGADNTFLSDINDSGEIVGVYQDGSGYHGFTYRNGVYTTLDLPGSPVAGTGPSLVNSSGEIIGAYYQPFSPGIGHYGYTPFLYSDGVYTTLNPPGPGPHPYIFATDINDLGQVVGYYSNTYAEPGFLYSNGVYTTFDVPGFQDIVGATINNSGEIIVTANGDGGKQGSFLYIDGVFTPIEVPGSKFTYATDINDSGQIVGWYTDNSIDVYGFIYSNGAYRTLELRLSSDFALYYKRFRPNFRGVRHDRP